jgi:hypothetical protein
LELSYTSLKQLCQHYPEEVGAGPYLSNVVIASAFQTHSLIFKSHRP